MPEDPVPVTGGPLPWRLEVEGEAPAGLSAMLALPDLAGDPAIEYRPAAAQAIELHLDPEGGLAVVRLLGPARAPVEAAWAAASEAGGLSLARHDDGGFAPVELAVDPRRSAAGVDPVTIVQGGLRLRLRAPEVHRYDLADGVPLRARAWGEGADHRFAATVEAAGGCRSEASVSFRDSLAALCEGWGRELGADLSCIPPRIALPGVVRPGPETPSAPPPPVGSAGATLGR